MKIQKFLQFISCVLFITLSNFAFSQNSYTYDSPSSAIGPHGVARCSSVEVDAVRKMNNPGIPDISTFEEWLAPQIVKIRAKMEENPSKSVNTILQIPVVVHILHNGEPIGTAPNITDAQVLSQIQVLNDDFRKATGTRGFNNDPVGADTEIEFVLALSDENGNETNGINRRNINQDGATRDDLENVIKPATIWDPTMFLNMWTLKFAAPDDNLLGYAQFPGGSGLAGMPGGPDSENPDTDGVVMRYNSFGTSDADDGSFLLDAPYDLGRTATHEVGHWVGLRHIWGDGLGCNLGTAPPMCSCNEDDFCTDTPNSEKANYSCDGSEQSSCEVPATNDMTANYMDYSSDDCMNIFTLDQKARIIAVMTNSPRRMELPTSQGLLAPAPRVSFAITESSILEGSSCNSSIVNIDLTIGAAPSSDAVVSLSVSGSATGSGVDFSLSSNTVTFPAGSNTNQTITIEISEDATIEDNENIILTIDNVNGGGSSAASFNQTHTLTISDDDKLPLEAGLQTGVTIFNETFAQGLTNWTTTTSPGASIDWRAGDPVGGIAQSAYVAQTTVADLYKYDGITAGTCRLESPSIDASNAKNLQLTFDYQCFGETGFDFGSLLYSIDNGASYRTLVSSYSDQLTPTQATVQLPVDAAGCQELKLAFLWVNDALAELNPPFNIDNVVVTASTFAPVDVNDQVNTANPDQQELSPMSTVYFYDQATGKIMMSVTNNSNFDYACTTVETDRTRASAGQNTSLFWNANSENALMSQTFFLETENTNPDANAVLDVKLYYNNNDVQSWEIATGNSRNDLELVSVKDNRISVVNQNNFSDYEVGVSTAILGQYNTSRVTIEGSISANNSGLGAGIPGVSAVLPVELSEFSGKMEKETIELNWITVQEIDNDYFTLERSNDGVHFAKIATIEGAGTQSETSYYEFTDENPLLGENYYRLRQTNFDGTFSYSKTIVFTFENIKDLSVYPNPAQDQIYVSIEDDFTEKSVLLLSMRGEVIKRKWLSNSCVFETRNLSEGIYFIKVEGQSAQKVLIKR